jgi:hypothetical protein
VGIGELRTAAGPDVHGRLLPTCWRYSNLAIGHRFPRGASPPAGAELPNLGEYSGQVPDPGSLLTCSFCGKSQQQVKQLVVGT